MKPAAKNSVLIVEDDPAVREMLRFMLARGGYATALAGDAQEAERRLQETHPQVILLDWMLPGMDGVQYARQLKSQSHTADIAIIMVTAKAEEADTIRGLDGGADDYVTKPFSAKELLARVRAAMRRANPGRGGAGAPITHDDIVIDPDGHAVSIGGQSVALGVKEFALLYAFLRRPTRVHSRTSLLDQVWGKDRYVDERTVDVYIRRLRRELKRHGREGLVQTVRGVGYRLRGGA